MAPNADDTCQALAKYIEARLAMPIDWVGDVPWDVRERMLDSGEIDLCWICGLPYVEKADRRAPIAVCVAPVMHHPRYRREAVYFSDVVVCAESRYRTFADLQGESWAYNEPRSHSGCNLVSYHLAIQGRGWEYFGEAIEAGSHQAAIEMILEGAASGAAIDSTVLEAQLRRRPELEERIRVLLTLGPSPAPPWVVSTRVDRNLRSRIVDVLASVHRSPEGAAILASWGIAELRPVDDAFYEPIRHMARIARSVNRPITEHRSVRAVPWPR